MNFVWSFVFCRHEGGPSSFSDGPLGTICLHIKVDAVGDSDEHTAVGDAAVLGHAHADTVASGVNHRLEVARRALPPPRYCPCSCSHGQVHLLTSLYTLAQSANRSATFWHFAGAARIHSLKIHPTPLLQNTFAKSPPLRYNPHNTTELEERLHGKNSSCGR